MILCVRCGLVPTPTGLCPQHEFEYPDDWARSNRILCDFFHRQIEPARVEVGLRDDEWALSA